MAIECLDWLGHVATRKPASRARHRLALGSSQARSCRRHRSHQDAGVRFSTITGDHPATVVAIANAVGIASTAVVTGAQLDCMDTDELEWTVANVGVFARVGAETQTRDRRSPRGPR